MNTIQSPGKNTRLLKYIISLMALALLIGPALVALSHDNLTGLSRGSFRSSPGSMFSPLAGPMNMEPEFTINSDVGDQYETRMAYHGSTNRFLVVWADTNLGSANRIRAQALRPDGTAAGPVQNISSAPGRNPNIAHNLESTDDVAGARSLIVWATNTEIMGRIVRSDGTPDEGEFLIGSITPGTGFVNRPVVAKAAHNPNCCDSRFLVTWSKVGTGLSCSGEPCGIYGRIINVAGEMSQRFRSDTFAIASSSQTGGQPNRPAVAFDYLTGVPGNPGHLQGQYLVVWEENKGSGFAIYGRYVDQAGVPLGTQSFAVSTNPGVMLSPSVAFSPESQSGRMLVVWEGAVSGAFDIFGQRVKSDGTLAGPNFAVTSDPGDQRNSHLAYSLALGEYLVAWSDIASRTVSARAVNLDGSMPRNTVIISQVGTPVAPEQVTPTVAAAEPLTDLEPLGSDPGDFIPNRFEFIVAWTGASTVRSDESDTFGRTVELHFDTDGDALLDDWETDGIDVNNDGVVDAINDLKLSSIDPNNPADPRRKDVFLEIDWMDCAAGGCPPGDTHNHRPKDLNGDGVPEIFEVMIEAFRNDHSPALIRNPDASFNGVTLHIDYGQMGGASAIPDDRVNIVSPGSRQANFDRRRLRAFHYGQASHACCGGADLPGSFFWAGRGGDETTRAEAIQIASNTFMHELGHNLGLFHGGRKDGTNNKPNYLSIMNYSFSGGIPRTSGTPILDYSTRQLLTLNENALNESIGLGGLAALSGIKTIHSCASGDFTIAPAEGAIDWDCNGMIDPGTVPVSINFDPAKTELQGADDWSQLFFNLRGITNYGSAAIPPPDEPNPFNIGLAFGLSLQGDGASDLMGFDQTTGEYRFTRCGAAGFVLTGKGSVNIKGCTITLVHNASDRRVLIKFDSCSHRGTASVQVLSRGNTFSITDRDTSNNSLMCR